MEAGLKEEHYRVLIDLLDLVARKDIVFYRNIKEVVDSICDGQIVFIKYKVKDK